MKINSVAWIVALIALALTASLMTAQMVTAATDAGDADATTAGPQAHIDIVPDELPMCDRVSAQGVRIDSAQTWEAKADVVITLDDTCWAAKTTTNTIGTFSILLPLVHQRHYTETIGSGTSRTLVPKRTQAHVYVNGVKATIPIPYSLSDVDMYELGRTTSDMIIRSKSDPKLSRVAVSSRYTSDWVGIFDFKMITFYPTILTTEGEEAP